ncbi:CoA transferase [Trebonia sp.]|uniref:CoA transferase n=1 Tax=Trebonia sp. TaxID=2767075 RepID=UPI002618E6EC|nr:CoA transferase [Trebonia sp.]
MRTDSHDAARTAADTLVAELADVLDGRRPRVSLNPGDADSDWARSGAMYLTGRADGPPRLAPGAPASWARAAVGLLGAAARDIDGAALLGERAALSAGLHRNSPSSVGGAFRAIPGQDGWLGLSLARPDDRTALPALIEGPVTGDPWAALASWLAGKPVRTARERATMLGIPAAVIGNKPSGLSRPAVLATRGGSVAIRRKQPVVADLSSLWAGPLCAQLLSTCGARVIKVESIGRPDGARLGSPGFYALLHGGHESVALDFGSAAGRRALHALMSWADVIIEASRPRALRNLDIDAAEFVERGAVWVSITGYGRAAGERAGFGDDVAAGAGLVVDDAGRPVPVGDAIADPLTGVTAAAAAMWAITSSSGWLLDVSMHDVCAQAASVAAREREPCELACRQGRWWMETRDRPVPVLEPRARRMRSPAPSLGMHTQGVLTEVGRE